MLAPDPCVNIPTRVMSRSPRVVKIVQHHLHIVGRGRQALLQFADEPLPHGTIVIAMAGERGHEAHGSKTVFGHRILKPFIFESIVSAGYP